MPPTKLVDFSDPFYKKLLQEGVNATNEVGGLFRSFLTFCV
jgi:hypothetical protein